MKHVLLLLLSATLSSTHADDASEYQGGWEKMKPAALRTQFRLQGDMFVLDEAGQKFVSTTSEHREWRAGVKSDRIESAWTVSAKGFKSIALHNVWIIRPDNSIDVLIQQCDVIKEGHCGKVLREEHHALENFAPVTWVADNTPTARVVVRLTPMIDEVRDRENLDRLTLGGDRNSFMVFDNQGYVWSKETRFGGVVNGIKSVRGSVAFSLYPFTGATEIGYARGNTIEIDATDALKITIRNDRDVVPGETRAKIYGKYLPKLKASGINSVYSFGHEKESTIPAEFK